MNCIFPFIYKGENYSTCTNALLGELPEHEDKTGEDFFWCATATRENGLMVDNMWGKCNLCSCTNKPEDLNSRPMSKLELMNA